MKIIRDKEELEKYLSSIQGTLGFVPTMGALHNGHLSLIDIAKTNSDKTIVSIFVNPAQFAATEDLGKYPRPEEEDIKKLKSKNVDLAYIAKKDDIYPEGDDMKVSAGQIGKELEGITRPHFFDGVALVVTKLFHLIKPDIAVFGEKDFQQLHIIKQLAQNFEQPVKILGGPIIREENGLAMSSRNVYLSDEQKNIASSLYKTMQEAVQKINNGEDPEQSLKWATEALIERGFDKVDYLQIRSAKTLQKTEMIWRPARLLAAVYLNNIRLIDNIEI